MHRREFLRATLATGAAATLGSCRSTTSASPAARLLVLAFDGIDPQIVRSLMDAGRMPNLASMVERGSFRKLATSTPPHTPVAFSSILTGTDPNDYVLTMTFVGVGTDTIDEVDFKIDALATPSGYESKPTVMGPGPDTWTVWWDKLAGNPASCTGDTFQGQGVCAQSSVLGPAVLGTNVWTWLVLGVDAVAARQEYRISGQSFNARRMIRFVPFCFHAQNLLAVPAPTGWRPL